MGASLAAKIMGYAKNNSNLILFEEVSYTKTDFIKCSDTLCVTRCDIIYDKGVQYLSFLDIYGIRQEQLDKFKELYSLFDDSIPKPKTGIIDKKAATKAMRDGFKNIDLKLESMTILSRMVMDSEPKWFFDYNFTKRLTVPAYRTLAARGVVVDGLGNRLGLVLMVCKELNFERKVSKSGGFALRNMPDGVYMFTFSRAGYVSVEQEMVFYKGIRSEVKVVMDGI